MRIRRSRYVNIAGNWGAVARPISTAPIQTAAVRPLPTTNTPAARIVSQQAAASRTLGRILWPSALDSRRPTVNPTQNAVVSQVAARALNSISSPYVWIHPANPTSSPT